VVTVGETLRLPLAAFTVPMPLMVTDVAFKTRYDNCAAWPAWMLVGFAMKNRICTAAADVVVTRTLADADSPALFVTVRRKLYACPDAAVNVVIGWVLSESETAGPVSWTQR
jgi:hypothetical protein